MKHLNTHSYCVAISGKQPVLANWLHIEAVSFSSICGNMDLEQVGVFE
jgi:hypothetical protein